MAMKPNRTGDSPWRAAGLVGVMGLDIAVCLIAGYWLGQLASDRFGGSGGWIVLGLLLGLAAGIVSVVFLVKKVLSDSDG
jgi:ATP synthase protein I